VILAFLERKEVTGVLLVLEALLGGKVFLLGDD